MHRAVRGKKMIQVWTNGSQNGQIRAKLDRFGPVWTGFGQNRSGFPAKLLAPFLFATRARVLCFVSLLLPWHFVLHGMLVAALLLLLYLLMTLTSPSRHTQDMEMIQHQLPRDLDS